MKDMQCWRTLGNNKIFFIIIIYIYRLSKEGVEEHHTGAKSFCGSVAYLAPEMLKRVGHGKAVDWYLLGVVLYELLVGIPPYYANNR